jgi:precorrin-6A/cobalt-precorrin-6A reductase
LQNFRRPFFTLGREPLTHLDTILTTQYWTIRCLDAKPGNARVHIIGARGPFNLDSERDLFIENNFDVLISKNSGGAATEPKLQIARELKLPVLLLKRPPLPSVTREFETTAALIAAFATGAQYEGPR